MLKRDSFFDCEIKSIAAVTINDLGEVELHIGLNMGDGYKIITGFELIKLRLLLKMMNEAGRPLGDRE